MAEVWLATDVALSRQVAVKLLKPQLASDPVVTERFRREAVAAGRLNHPNIVAVYDAVEDNERLAVVMQYVPGRSLREVLDRERRLGVPQTLRIGIAVAAALDAAHAHDLVHRDVKPGNILLTPDARVLLTDFGIAKATSGGSDLTSDNVMMGTAKYLSPEQVRGRRLDGRADLYALGLVLYECLSGRVPFHGDSDADTALARLQRDPTPLERLRATVPADMVAVIHRMMARDPDARPSSGAEVQVALERIATTVDMTPGAPPESPPRPTVAPVEPQQPPPPAPAPAAEREPTPDPVAVPVRALAGAEPVAVSAPAPSPLAHETVGARVGAGVAAGDKTVVTAGSSTRLADPLLDRTPGRPPPRRDSTPPAGGMRMGRPHRSFQHRRGPSLLVLGALLLAAAVAAVMLWLALRQDDEASPTDSTAAESDDTAAQAVAEGGDIRITSVRSFDPGGDGEENDENVGLIKDGDPNSAWRTECYANQYFGAKQGVGLVLHLNAAAHGRVSVTNVAAPWNVEIYASDDPPSTLAGWGRAVGQGAGQTSTTGTIDIDSDARYLLVLLRQAARDSACSNQNPFRAGIAELSITAG
jgi:serine/threonine-protein kinase